MRLLICLEPKLQPQNSRVSVWKITSQCGSSVPPLKLSKSEVPSACDRSLDDPSDPKWTAFSPRASPEAQRSLFSGEKPFSHFFSPHQAKHPHQSSLSKGSLERGIWLGLPGPRPGRICGIELQMRFLQCLDVFRAFEVGHPEVGRQ